MPIALPGPDRVPDGPQRDLLVRLHDLYGQAGKPATRFISRRIDDEKLESVSYETVSAVLRGKSVPSWARLRSIIVVLCRMSVHKIDVSQELVHFNDLWRRFESPPGASAAPEDPPDRSPIARPYPAPLPAIETAAAEVARSGAFRAVVSRVHGALPERAAMFTGREQLLDEIESRLARSPETPLILFGPVGAGKTQLAAEYVRLHRHRYAVSWWVAAENLDQARDSLLRLARNLGVDDAGDERRPFDRLFHLLEQSGPCLLVFDGVINGDLRALIRTSGGNVIVTTRNVEWARDIRHAEVDVPDLDEGESAQLLRKQDPHMTRSQMLRLVGVVGRSPAGLAEACRLYREHATSWDDLADRLADPANRVLTGEGRPHGPLVDEVRSSLDRVAGEPDLIRLLTLLLGFGPSQIWRWALQAGAGRAVSAGVQRLLGDPPGLQQAMRILAAAGLGRRHAAGDWIEIPAIIRLVLRELLPRAYGEDNRNDVVQILVAADPGHPEDRRTLHLHRAIAPHIRPAALVGTPSPSTYRTIRHQIRYLFLVGELDEAQQLGREAEAALASRPVLAPTDELVLQIRRDLASALRAGGRYADAYRLTEEAMADIDSNQDFRADHSVALDVARSRGHDLRIAGEYQRAYELDEQTLRRHAAAFAEDDFRSLASRYNLSVSRRFLGRFRDAAEADRSDLNRLRSDRGGRADQRQARWANALAEDLYGLGRYPEVVELLAPLLEAVPGRELLRARRMTGVALRRLGRLVPAVEQLGVCHQACMNQLGERRELTLAVAMSLGNALRDLGQYPTALHYCSAAAEGYAAVMGPGNPVVHVARANLAAVHLATGDAQLAEAGLDEAYGALAARLDDRHPFAVLTAVNHASAVAMVDPVVACPLSGSAYQRARDVFGPDHLDTLIAAAGYAADRAARNENDTHAPSLDQILAVLRRRFGAGHPLVTRLADGGRATVDIELPSG